jgi:hypothetical protein
MFRRRVGRSIPLNLFFVVLVVDLSPCLRVNGEQALSGFFDGNRMLTRETIAIGLLWISLTVPP